MAHAHGINRERVNTDAGVHDIARAGELQWLRQAALCGIAGAIWFGEGYQYLITFTTSSSTVIDTRARRSVFRVLLAPEFS